MSQFIKRATNLWRQWQRVKLQDRYIVFLVILRSFFASVLILAAQASISGAVHAQSNKTTPKAANKDEILTYVNMSIATFCEARGQKIDFPKSIAVAVVTQGFPIFTKHGGLVQGLTKPLDEKQFIGNASFMIMAGSLKRCPKLVPADEKAKFEKAVAAAAAAKKSAK